MVEDLSPKLMIQNQFRFSGILQTEDFWSCVTEYGRYKTV